MKNMKKLVLLMILASTPAFAGLTTCSALCGYESGSTLKLLSNPGIDKTSWDGSASIFNDIDEACHQRVTKELGEKVKHVLLAQTVIATSSTTTATTLVFARAVDSCRSE